MSTDGTDGTDGGDRDGRTTALVALLSHRAGVDAREREALRETLTWLTALPHPFDEGAHRVHVTASAVVLGTRGTLLHRHKRLGLWMQPGGHLDPGEEPADAALREVREETGLRVRHPETGPELLHVDVHEGGRGHRHLDVRFRLLADDEDPCPPPGESQEVAWFPLDRALALADPGLVGALRAVMTTGQR